MATVIQLPPDPSFGSGRIGGLLGKLATAMVEGRRQQKEDEERRRILQQAMDAALAADPEEMEAVFAQGVSGIARDAKELDEFVKFFSGIREQAKKERLAESLSRLGPQPVTLPPVDIRPGRKGPVQLQRRVAPPDLASVASQFVGAGEKIPPALSKRLFDRPELSLAERAEEKRVLAEAGKTGELAARRKGINEILNSAGRLASPLLDPATLFSGDRAGNDARTIVRLLGTARRLAAGGETAISNNLLAQARFLAENSGEIARRKELDKVLSPRAASELRMPIGTTLGEVVGTTPRSPEQVARSVAIARGEGLGVVKAKEQIGFINQAQTTITNLLDEIERDPGIVGIRGSLRATGKTAVGVLSDLDLTGIIDKAKEIAFSQTDLSLDEQRGLFDSPTLSILKTIENSVGLILARLRHPVGRVPVAVIRISINDVKLRGLTSSQQVVDRLTFISNLLGGRKRNLVGRFNIPQAKEPRRFRFDYGARELREVP